MSFILYYLFGFLGTGIVLTFRIGGAHESDMNKGFLILVGSVFWPITVVFTCAMIIIETLGETSTKLDAWARRKWKWFR